MGGGGFGWGHLGFGGRVTCVRAMGQRYPKVPHPRLASVGASAVGAVGKAGHGPFISRGPERNHDSQICGEF